MNQKYLCKVCNSACKSLDASMLCVTNVVSNTWINIQSGGESWIGYSNNNSFGNLSWVEGCSSTYTNWDFGQPFGKYISHQLYL